MDGASRMTQPQLSTTSKILPPLPPRASRAMAGCPGCSPSLTAAALPRLVLLTETCLNLNHFWKGFFRVVPCGAAWMGLHTSAEMRLLLGAERGTSPAAGMWGQTAAGGGEQSIQRQKLVQEPGLGAVSWSCAEAKPRRSDLRSWGAAGAAGLQSRREMVGAAVLERGGEEGWGAALLGEGGWMRWGGCFGAVLP